MRSMVDVRYVDVISGVVGIAEHHLVCHQPDPYGPVGLFIGNSLCQYLTNVISTALLIQTCGEILLG